MQPSAGLELPAARLSPCPPGCALPSRHRRRLLAVWRPTRPGRGAAPGGPHVTWPPSRLEQPVHPPLHAGAPSRRRPAPPWTPGQAGATRQRRQQLEWKPLTGTERPEHPHARRQHLLGAPPPPGPSQTPALRQPRQLLGWRHAGRRSPGCGLTRQSTAVCLPPGRPPCPPELGRTRRARQQLPPHGRRPLQPQRMPRQRVTETRGCAAALSTAPAGRAPCRQHVAALLLPCLSTALSPAQQPARRAAQPPSAPREKLCHGGECPGETPPASAARWI